MTEEKVDQTFDVYDWVNESYLTKILEHYESKPIKLQTSTVRHATGKGENYVGAVFRATVEYTVDDENDSKTISMIIKAKTDENEEIREIVEEYNIFNRELQLYRFLLPECERLLRTINDSTTIGPKFIYGDDRAIVLEDLAVKGYKLKDVKKRLNLDECKAVLGKVAKFHACTAVINTKNPDLFKYHRQANIGEKFTPYHLVYQNTIKSSIKFTKTVPELRKYVEKLELFGSDIISKMVQVFSLDSEDSFYSLNQGDLWVNNLLFNDENDVILVDYQEGFYGSIGIDLNFFMYTSCNQDVLSNQLDELKQFYHDILSETLTSLNYSKPIPTLAVINDEINKKGNHGLATLLCIVPMLIIDKKELADARYVFSDDEESQSVRDIIFSNEKYRQLLIDNLSVFTKNGHL